MDHRIQVTKGSEEKKVSPEDTDDSKDILQDQTSMNIEPMEVSPKDIDGGGDVLQDQIPKIIDEKKVSPEDTDDCKDILQDQTSKNIEPMEVSPKDIDDCGDVLQYQTPKITDDMDVSPKDTDDSQNALQDQIHKTGTNLTALRKQILTFCRQEAYKNQQLSSGISAETSTSAPKLQSTSNYQSSITDSSSTDGRSPSPVDNEVSEAFRGHFNIHRPACKLSVYLSDAQKLLLSILQEIMEFSDDGEQYTVIHNLFLCNSESHCQKTESCLHSKLLSCMCDRETVFRTKNLFTHHNTLQYDTEKFYESLVDIVVMTLYFTVTVRSSLKFDDMIRLYKIFKDKYEVDFWRRENVDGVQDEASRNWVKVLQKKMQSVLLQTMTAFQFLLMHIGKHARQRKIDEYVKDLREEDKRYLKRKI